MSVIDAKETCGSFLEIRNLVHVNFQFNRRFGIERTITSLPGSVNPAGI